MKSILIFCLPLIMHSKALESSNSGEPTSTSVRLKGHSALIFGKSEITIKTRTQGEVMEVKVFEGQKIKRGELISQLDDRQEQIDRQLAETEVRLAKDDWDKTAKLKRYVSADEINQKEVNYQKKKTTLDTKKLDIDKKKILSPIDGVVTRVYFEKGETVASGEKFAEVVQMDDLYLVANVPSSEAGKFREGSSFKFKLNNESKNTYSAKVIFSSPVIDASSDTIRVKLETKNVQDHEQYVLKPGMIVTLVD